MENRRPISSRWRVARFLTGYEHWTMRLLADKMVALGYVEQVSHKTVWETLKNRQSKSAD